MPSPEALKAAEGRTIRDVLAPGLDVVFCGINPGLYSGVVGHHFARPGNRFWTTLHAAGFTDRLLRPHEERALLRYGYGLTNIVSRATAAAADLGPEELAEGGAALEAKIHRDRPRYLAVLGIGAYRTAWRRSTASPGLQAERVGDTAIWVLPNPSGLNAHYRPRELARLFGGLRAAVEAETGVAGQAP